MRKVKIVSTIGPASSSYEIIEKLLLAGTNIFRLNFSHGTHASHLDALKKIRAASQKTGLVSAVLADLQGPKIRVGELLDGPVELKTGSRVIITTRKVRGDSKEIPTSYEALPRDVRKGDRILLDDGLLELRVLDIKNNDVLCEVINGGLLKQKKGINLPGVPVSAPALTDKDRDDLLFALKNNVDYIALSFVRWPGDLRKVKSIIHSMKLNTPVIAKIERAEAIENFDEILKLSDGIMIARGDMGVELSPESVPLIQKQLIKACILHARPVITATQMLESMMENPRPTRAEASDVANAVLDGTDATMLSGETAAGKHPVEAVMMMDRIIKETENKMELDSRKSRSSNEIVSETGDAICHAASVTAGALQAKAIVTFTHSGSTALYISSYRPQVPILAVTPVKSTLRRMALYWGVTPFLTKKVSSTDRMIDLAEQTLAEQGYIKDGDLIILTAGLPLGKPGTTNMLKVHEVDLLDAARKSELEEVREKNVKISVDRARCTGCGVCVKTCAASIFSLSGRRARLRRTKVQNCFLDGLCQTNCPVQAIRLTVRKQRQE